MKILPKILFFLSLVFLILFLFLMYQRNSPRTLAFNIQDIHEEEVQTGNYHATGIIISSIGVWLPVIPAHLSNGIWQTTNKGVSFLQGSAVSGEKGNAIFYGHNWANLLGKLPEVKPGDKIEIVFSDNTKKTFTVETTQEVTPNDISILAKTEDSRITIYTCTGFLDSKRFVVVAKPSI